MTFKIIAICLVSVSFLFNLFLSFLSFKARNNPIPVDVEDVYDKETYLKWKKYKVEYLVLDLVFSFVSFGITLALLLSNLLSLSVQNITNIYTASIVVVAIYLGINFVVGMVKEYIATMKIEQKYDFNKSSMKTFVFDQIKSLILTSGLTIGLLCLFIVIYENLHDYILVLFSGILFGFLLLFSFLYPVFSKIFNKFKSLEEGELRNRLIALLESHGYQVRDIKVMDASRRTSKSNAYFSGFSKMKTIVLYDNLLKVMDEDEIVAVFAHEMGHGLHKDTLKNSIRSLLNIILIVIIAWLLVRYPVIFNDFGFGSVNYGYALFLLGDVILSLFSILNFSDSYSHL